LPLRQMLLSFAAASFMRRLPPASAADIFHATPFSSLPPLTPFRQPLSSAPPFSPPTLFSHCHFRHVRFSSDADYAIISHSLLYMMPPLFSLPPFLIFAAITAAFTLPAFAIAVILTPLISFSLSPPAIIF